MLEKVVTKAVQILAPPRDQLCMLILVRRVLENYFLDDAVLVARMKRRYGLCLRKALQPLLALTSGTTMVSKIIFQYPHLLWRRF